MDVRPCDTENVIKLSDIRLDVSGMEADDKVMVSVTSSTDPGSIDLSTPVGGGDAVGPVAVATVKKGAVFTAGTDTPGLSCASDKPSSTVTIEEGFVGAWSDMLDGDWNRVPHQAGRRAGRRRG